MSRKCELAKIEADAGYITYPEEAPGKQLTFRENVHQAIEAAYKLGERLGREREREECAEIVNNLVMEHVGPQSLICYKINQAIRARGVASQEEK